ncbi:MAG: hypothetical protein HYY40_08465 [Bacteroidetes bacterium]|nr:hypothetical protein [Bacteroidota bacterium]
MVFISLSLIRSSAYGGSGTDMQRTLPTDDIMQFTPDRKGDAIIFPQRTGFFEIYDLVDKKPASKEVHIPSLTRRLKKGFILYRNG